MDEHKQSVVQEGQNPSPPSYDESGVTYPTQPSQQIASPALASQQDGHPTLEVKQDGYPTQQGVYAAPQGGYAAPQGGYAAPQGGFAAPQGGYAAPQGGFAAPPGGFAAPPGSFAAPQGGYATPQGGFPAPQVGYMMPTVSAMEKSPVMTVCSGCNGQVMTSVTNGKFNNKGMAWIVYSICFGIWLYLAALVFIDAFKTFTHRCPACGKILKQFNPPLTSGNKCLLILAILFQILATAVLVTFYVVQPWADDDGWLPFTTPRMII